MTIVRESIVRGTIIRDPWIKLIHPDFRGFSGQKRVFSRTTDNSPANNSQLTVFCLFDKKKRNEFLVVKKKEEKKL